TSNSHFGASLAVGDTNGDGFEDVIVGAFGHASFTGRAYVFHGGPGGDGVADLTLSGELTSDNFGLSVGFAGDVNADGFGDIIAGAYGHGLQKGRAYVYYGGPGADATADLVLDGDGSIQGLGNAVASAGDINRDGFGDLVVGASAFSSNRGRAHVFTAHRFLLTAPNGGDTWNVGATRTITWLGAEPADLWLSVDGGLTHQIIEARVGGEASNSVTFRVPHTPTKFARIKVTPTDASVDGLDRSDSLFTIQTSISLLALLAAPLPEGTSGTTISWQTDPGPEDLAGYRLEKAGTGSTSVDWRTIVPLTRETSHTDAEGGPGSRYRLFAVNGFGEELLLGEAAIRPAAVLSAWPLPYRGGALQVSFATAAGLGGGSGRTELAIFDVHGRLVRTIDAGAYPAGYRTVTWDGRDSKGQHAPAGVYFLRTRGELGYERSMKITVLR
ncbi:MAG TPA: FlgD immunoglobulin-like domain containing protein, partial [Candidatus Eisenbacteria bacterium]|nr:FlgD immunoglobulin-like domain containing protein [Candidatus Eisenbacteria bacterium]